MSGWMSDDTVRGFGNGAPVTDVARGRDTPSSYTGGRRRANTVNDFPHSGLRTLLQWPVKVRNGEDGSHGAEKSSHCGSSDIGEMEPDSSEFTSMFCKLFVKSSRNTPINVFVSNVCRLRRADLYENVKN